jgi:hypothetical protein
VALPDGDSEAMAAGLSLIRAHLDDAGAWRHLLLGSGGEVLGKGGIKTVVRASGTPELTHLNPVRALSVRL